MKKLLVAAMLSVFAVSAPALAEGEAKPKKQFSEAQLAQQQKMKDCNAEAKADGAKGQERKDFMKTCLSGGAQAAKDGRAAQKEKMKTCNADAKEKALKGQERKDFMKGCLSAS